MRWAEKYLHIPFKDRGDNFDGCDCWGLVCLIFRERRNIELPLYEDIGKGQSPEKLKQILREADGPNWAMIDPSCEDVYDVVLMKAIYQVDGKSRVGEIHIGLVIDNGAMIHIERGCEVTIARYRDDHRVKNRIVGFFRYEPDTSYIQA